MRSLARLLALLCTLSLAVSAMARTATYGAVAEQRAEGSVPLSAALRAPLGRYGPFRVLDAQTAALVGTTDEGSPAALRAMLRDHPGLTRLALVECPGTSDDRSNLAVGRMIRAAGLAVHVPEGGSVRSGAVELLVAGTSLRIDDRAEFAVHAWRDEYGRQASEYASNAPAHTKYLAYYREMGMSEQAATRFYAMTNAVPFDDPRWLTGAEMRRWLGGGGAGARLAHLDLGPAVN